ncbi:50S ribosomal protein L4 [Candidatus Pacearchaeota archaeon]|nr:50S ribosomal protein L4 [Candidatus Pacearchaeota archaeon]|tara:strand:+ start:5932 stop:6738 length:807 start_codon:yes stop_codon:yes gene_type:complete
MKAQLYSKDGKGKGDIELPDLFSKDIRSDLVQKYINASVVLKTQPYSHDPKAGKKHSASGTISHKRHDWKGHYGRGISRVPRKTMWRRGTQFYWIGAELSSARGGRRAHGPKLVKRIRKINKKEIQKAFNSALSATAFPEQIVSRYSSINKIESVPAVIESLPEKTKDLKNAIKNIFQNMDNIVFKNKTVRAGKGKARGRKYKSNPGLLIIKADSEKVKSKEFDIVSINELSISDLYPLGRLTLYTKKSLSESPQEPVEPKESKEESK